MKTMVHQLYCVFGDATRISLFKPVITLINAGPRTRVSPINKWRRERSTERGNLGNFWDKVSSGQVAAVRGKPLA